MLRSETISVVRLADCQVNLDDWLGEPLAAVWTSHLKTLSEQTRSSYQKEVGRLLLWLTAEAKNQPSGNITRLCRYDADRFLAFLSNPDKSWVGPSRPLSHPDWKPLRGALSESSINQSKLVLAHFFDIISPEWINPFRSSHNHLGTTPARSRITQRAYDAQARAAYWQWMIARAPSPRVTRERWLIALMLSTGMRRAEVSAARMNDFECRKGQWGIVVRGHKLSRWVLATELLMSELARYRRAMRLPGDTPTADDKSPLLGSIYSGKPVTSRAIANVIAFSLDEFLRNPPDMPMNVLSRISHATSKWFHPEIPAT